MIKNLILLISAVATQGLGFLLYFITDNKILTLGYTVIAFFIGLIVINNTNEAEKNRN